MNEIIALLRQMWPEELKRFNDEELLSEYSCFKATEFDNNDERFLEWIVATDG